MTRTLILALIFCLPAAATARTNVKLSKTGDHFRQRTEITDSATSGGKLEFNTFRGGIQVDTWPKDEIKIVVTQKAEIITEDESKAIFRQVKVDHAKSGTTQRVNIKRESKRELKTLSITTEITIPEKFNVHVETEGGVIRLSDIEGNVKVKTGGGGTRSGKLKNGRVDIVSGGGAIRLGEVLGGPVKVTTGGGSIRMGPVSGDISAKSGGGSIRLAYVHGNVRIQTGGGSIKAEETTGNLSAQSGGGVIQSGPVGGDADISTAGGQIRIGPVTGKVQAKSSGGGTTVSGAKGPITTRTAGGRIRIENAANSIDAQSGGGSIRADFTPSAANASCTLTTSGGAITLRIPKGLSASVDASLRITKDRRNNDYGIFSEFPIAVQEKESKHITATGDINGGGAKLSLSTKNGHIRINTLPEEH